MSANAAGAPTGPEDKVRKDLVQVFFGLVLTQIAVYITSLVDIWNGWSVEYCAAWSHVILGFALTTTSWFGWQMSVRNARLKEEASVFQVGFALSLLDIFLVTLYFLLVHQVEMEGVAAFPPLVKPTLTAPSAVAEAWIILVVFAVYAAWDTISLFFSDKEYRPWPSAVCTLLASLALIPTFKVVPDRPDAVLWVDAFLLGLVFLFRAFKRLQKWNFVNRRGQSTFQFGPAPNDVKGWVIACVIASVISYLVAIAPLARSWVCG